MNEQRIPAGYHRARGVEGSEQYGKSKQGNDQVAIDVDLLDLNERVTTFLPFTADAEPYSVDRLKALGWKGGDTLAGIGENEVTAEVKYETYDGKLQMKVQIMTGGGRVVLKNPMNEPEKRAFMARLSSIAKSGAKPAQNAGSGGYPANWDDPASKAAPSVKY